MRRRFALGSSNRQGELTKADYEKVKILDLFEQLPEVPKELEKLTQLTSLDLRDNPDLTKAQIAELQKALPNCEITSDFDIEVFD